MVYRNGILSELLRARTWVVVLIALQMVLVMPPAADEAEAVTWDAPYIVASGSVGYPMAMAVDGDNVYCVYVVDNRGIFSIVMRWFDGDAWSSVLTVAQGTGSNVNDPDVAASNGIAHITYVDSIDRDSDVMYRSYNGTYFSVVQQASSVRDGDNSIDPAIAADGSHVYIVWEEDLGVDRDIQYRYIFDGRLGATGTLNIEVDDDWQTDPAVAMDDGKAHVVWSERVAGGDYDIIYRMWNGASWTGETNLLPVMDRDHQEYPDVDADGDDVYVVFRHQAGATNYWIDMVTYTNLRWGTPSQVPDPSGTEGLPRIGAEAGHVALVYLNSGTYHSAYFQLYDGQSWDTAEALETGDAAHTYWPTGVELENGRAHVTAVDDTGTSITHRYYVAAVDEADPSAEVGEVSPYWMANGRISLSWSASDDYSLDSVVVQYRYSEDKATWDRWTEVETIEGLSGTVASGTVSFGSPDGEGFYEFKAYARDVAGRSEPPSTDPEAEAALDQTPPTCSLLINDGDEYTGDSHVSLNVSYSDVMTDLNGSTGRGEYIVELSNDGTNWTEVTVHGNKHAWDLAGGEGGRTVHMRVTDEAGLTSAVATDRIVVDLTDPNMTVVIEDGAEWTASRDVDLTISYEELGSGVAGIRILAEAIGGDEPWEDPVETMRFTLAEGDGLATIYYQVMDNVGRTSEVHTATIGLDTTAPTGSILVEGGDTYTTDRTVTLTLTAGDETSGVAGIRVTNEAIGGDEPWENPVDTLEWELAAGSGEMTVHYQVIDVAGTVSEVYSDSIILDTDKPTGSIALTGGVHLVNGPAIELVLSFEDATSEVVGIRVSNEAIGGDEPWENPVDLLPWTLPIGDGEKTVYYQVEDASGQVSPVYSLTVTLDATNPFVDSTEPADLAEKVPVDRAVTVRFSEAMDAATVEGAFALTYTDAGSVQEVDGTFSWSSDGRTLTFTPDEDLAKGRSFTLAISTDASDAAGNGLFPAVSCAFETAGDGGDDGGDDGIPPWTIVAILVVVVLAAVIGLQMMRGKGKAT